VFPESKKPSPITGWASFRGTAYPVIVAPFGLTLGGGAEMTLHASRVQAHAELYMGLVEVGVGLIPADHAVTDAVGCESEIPGTRNSSWGRVCAMHPSEIRAGTALAREVNYLLDNGYRWSANGLSLVPK
jgi:hypothetical protein